MSGLSPAVHFFLQINSPAEWTGTGNREQGIAKPRSADCFYLAPEGDNYLQGLTSRRRPLRFRSGQAFVGQRGWALGEPFSQFAGRRFYTNRKSLLATWAFTGIDPTTGP